MSVRWQSGSWRRAACAAALLLSGLATGCGGRADEDDEQATRAAIAAVKVSPGWTALPDAQRRALDVLLSGQDNPWSLGAREAVRDLVEDARWSGGAAAQAALLDGLWRDARVRPRSVATLGLSRATHAPYTLRPAAPLGTVELEGVATALERHVLVVDGRTVHIDAPAGARTDTSDGTLLSPDDAARSIAGLPRGARDQLEAMVLVPFKNPRDDAYAKDLGMPGFRTFMEGRSSGKVLVFPRVRASVDPVDMLLHEVAHVWSLRDLDEEGWRAWEEAEREDGHEVSTYAATHAREDLAETAAVYVAMRARPGGAEVRAMFGARFRLLDRWTPSVD